MSSNSPRHSVLRKILILLLSCALVFFQASCQGNLLATPMPSPDVPLTEIAQQVGFLQLELTRVAPTLDAIAKAEDNPAPPTPEPTIETPVATTPAPSLDPTLKIKPTSMPAATLAADRIIYQDEFSFDSGWVVETADRYTLQYKSGGYRIYSRSKTNPIWSVRNRELKDTVIEADVVSTKGPENAYYGLICRFQGNRSYYMLVVNMDGIAEIIRVQSRDLVSLARSTELTDVLRSNQNRLRADCIRDRLTFYINNQKVLDAQDGTFASGGAGLVVGNRNDQGIDVIFDNFLIYVP